MAVINPNVEIARFDAIMDRRIIEAPTEFDKAVLRKSKQMWHIAGIPKQNSNRVITNLKARVISFIAHKTTPRPPAQPPQPDREISASSLNLSN